MKRKAEMQFWILMISSAAASAAAGLYFMWFVLMPAFSEKTIELIVFVYGVFFTPVLFGIVLFMRNKIFFAEDDKEDTGNTTFWKSKPSKEEESTDKKYSRLELLAKHATKNSNQIYSRSGFHMLMGVIFALGGIGLFFVIDFLPGYSIQLPLTLNNENVSQYIAIQAARFLPKIGVLIFVELIAFYFLKQYRYGMDEYKYYLGIEQKAYERWHIFELLKEDREAISLLMEMKKFPVYVENGILKTGETTESIKYRETSPDEMEIIKDTASAFSPLKSRQTNRGKKEV